MQNFHQKILLRRKVMPELLSTLIILFFTIFWAILFWRLMRAHETLAEAVDRISISLNKQESMNRPNQENQENQVK